MVERRFLGELIALENRLSRGYGDGQAADRRSGKALPVIAASRLLRPPLGSRDVM